MLAQGLESPEGHEMERAESKTRQRSKSTLIVNQTVVTLRMLTCGTFLKGRCRTVKGERCRRELFPLYEPYDELE